MRISQVVAALQELQEEHGDVQVRAFDYGDISVYPVTEVKADRDRGRRAPVYVLVRP